MQKTTTYRVTIRLSRQSVALLDMLRYEGATVIDWSWGDTHDHAEIVLESQRFEKDRWESFGIFPKMVSVR